MEKKKTVKIGLVGCGGMGSNHLNTLMAMEHAEIVGVCDIDREKADLWAEKTGAPPFYNHSDLFDKSGLEAVLIATPHYAHTPISIEAFEKGLHVLCEKPLAVITRDGQKSIDAYEKAAGGLKEELIFAIMFQERTYPFHKKVKDILNGGELGKLIRVTWINTQWFRSQAYFDSGGWRATWAGEGGGILTNQCPHNLDMYQWLFGVPSRISGHVHLGKYHDIEVEDEVSAYFEHDNGMIGHLIVNTIESPGTNRLEIVGEMGTLIYEKEKILFLRNRKSILTHCKETKERFGGVECWPTEIPVKTDQPFNHKVVIDQFLKSILEKKSDLIARGHEGMGGLSIGNAIMLSSFTGRTVEMPFDPDEYEVILRDLAAKSRYKKKIVTAQEDDLAGSFT